MSAWPRFPVRNDAPVLPGGGARLWLQSSTTAFVLLLLLYGAALAGPHLLTDEAVYSRAIVAFAAGEPLSTVPGWYYPTPAAALGAGLRSLIGEHALFFGVRLLNLAGIAATLGWVVAEYPGAGGARAVLWRGVLLLALAWIPAVETAATCGNVSGLLMLPLLLAMAVQGGPRVALLSAGFLLKPYGLALVLTQRPRIALVPLLAAAGALVWTANRGVFPNADATRNAAIGRGLHELGLTLPWQVPTALALLAALLLRPRGPAALALGWLALPIAWDHTALLLLPAVSVAVCRPPTVAGDVRLGRVLALLAAAVVLQSGLFGSDSFPRVLSGLLGLLPAAAAIFVAVAAARSAVQPEGLGRGAERGPAPA